MHYLFIAAFLWGTSFIAGKVAYETLDPALTVAGRLLIASIVLLPVTIRFLQTHSIVKTATVDTNTTATADITDTDTINALNTKTVVTITNMAWLVFLGVLTYPFTFMLQFIGLELTSAASATTVLGFLPIMSVIVGAVFFQQKISPLILMLSFVAFVGIALLVGFAGLQHVSLFGCFLVFLSTVVVGFWLQLSKKMLGVIAPTYYTALTIQLGTLAGLPFMLMMVKNWGFEWTLQGVLAIVYLGVGCSFLAGWLWNKGLQTNGASQSSIFFALEPVFGVLLAVLFLGEQLNLVSIIGIGLVLSAAFIATLVPQDTAFKDKD